ncbi:MAG: hypothetical protein V1875_08770 [Candidatus Altiarchaeota archaeon]
MTVLSGCICDPPNDPDAKLVCNQPYIQVGNSCCLDRNKNGICDADELTTTTRATTPTTAAPTTTSAPVTTQTMPATVTTTVTTTVPAVACSMNKDCGDVINYTKCYNGNVVMYVETPICTNPGKPAAQCIKKSKTNAYEACPEGTKCISAECVLEDLITCDSACADKAYSDWYCNSDSSCAGSDVRASLGDVSCSPGSTDGYCCCQADSLTTPPTIPTHNACVGIGACAAVLGAGADSCNSNAECDIALIEIHSVCSGGACIASLGPGADECSSDSDCSSGPTLVMPPPMHRACLGATCGWAFGAGANECTSSAQCLGPIIVHNVCSAGACVASIGPGADQCTSDVNCFIGPTLPMTHKACVGTTCKAVAGFGADQCSSNIQCMSLSPILTHKACQGTKCVSVAGAGINTCTTNLQCTTMVTLSPGVTLNTVPTITIPHYIPDIPGF